MHLVFVYGTLKKGFRNYKYYLDQLEPTKAILKGFELHSGPGFPYANYGKGTIHGEVYQIDKGKLQRLDYLEGIPNHYQRVVCYPEANGKELECWIYISNNAANYPKIEDGIWK